MLSLGTTPPLGVTGNVDVCTCTYRIKMTKRNTLTCKLIKKTHLMLYYGSVNNWRLWVRIYLIISKFAGTLYKLPDNHKSGEGVCFEMLLCRDGAIWIGCDLHVNGGLGEVYTDSRRAGAEHRRVQVCCCWQWHTSTLCVAVWLPAICRWVCHIPL